MNNFFELETEEFDWFENELEIFESEEQYQKIEDLKRTCEEVKISEEISAEDMEDAEGVVWQYCENLQESMQFVFSRIYEDLCGSRLQISSDLLADYIDELNEKCVVLQSDIVPKQTKFSGVVARIEGCLAEGGVVVLGVSDSKWRAFIGEPESCFLDSGLRIVQVTNYDRDSLWVKDCADKHGQSIKISKNEIVLLDGILLEVYK